MQSKHFGGSLSVSIEGYTVHYLEGVDDQLLLDFHSFLSDGKVQHASTVYNHLTKLIEKLQESEVLAKSGGSILSFTDGCASQYRSATSLYFMSLLSSRFGVVIDRGISAAGHGKSIVDAINGVDKNTILRRTARRVQEAEYALDPNSKSLQVHSFNNASDERYSAAADCKRILQEEGGEGVKSAGKKHQKRESNRGINHRYHHVRGLDEKLSQARCQTIKIPEKGVTFTDMYNYYTCPELGGLRAALRRIPCNCSACDEIIRKPWIHGKDPEDQPRFKLAENCSLRPVLGDSNKWYIVDMELSTKGVPEDADEAYEEVLHHMTSTIAESVEVGQVGAVATSEDDDGYWLIKFTSLPFPNQETGNLEVEGEWFYPFPGARHWFYQDESSKVETVSLEHVVAAGIVMLDIGPKNPPPRASQEAAIQNKAQKINEDCHHMVMDEILRRERLEYDPTRVLVGDEDEDNFDSDSESESEE